MPRRYQSVFVHIVIKGSTIPKNPNGITLYKNLHLKLKINLFDDTRFK